MNTIADVLRRQGFCKYRDFGQQDRIDSLLAVTSLSPKNHSVERQFHCLASWKRFGLKVVARNSGREIEAIREFYPIVDYWIEDNETSSGFGSPTPLIRNLAGTAIELNQTILLLNSDIELIGRQGLLLNAINQSEQVLGLRWDYQHNPDTATEQQWGIDAFTFTPEQAKILFETEFPFAIAKPTWDYAVPLAMRRKGVNFRFLHAPLMFHKIHKVNWSQDEWRLGAYWIKRIFGADSGTAASRNVFDPCYKYADGRWKPI